MHKLLSILTAFIVLFGLMIGTFTSGKAAPQSAVMPSESINIAHFFKPPQGMNAATATDHFNMIILTNGDHTYQNQLKASGFPSDIPQYFRADGIQDPGGCTATPLNNQAAYKTGDFCFISQNHPDWFLLDSSGRRITVTSGGDYYRMDPANAGWKDFFLSRVMESQDQYGWSSLFLDNVEGSLSKFFGPKPVKYPNNSSYQTAVEGFLQYLDVNYSQRYGRSIVGNIVARADDAVWFTYLQHLDGAMQERFAVAWDETDYLDAEDWLEDLAFMEQTQARGKYVILVAPGNRSDTNRQRFAFASYLLISQGKAAFRYSTDDSYREVWLYDNYKMNLGSPLGPRYRTGTSWRRDFTNGYVVVNPANRTAVISNVVTTFIDVPETHRFYRQIEAFYDADITTGCSQTPRKFCPDSLVTRGEMAVFIERALGNFEPNPNPTGMFEDIPYPGLEHFTRFIEEFYNDGVTTGCSESPRKYCPQNQVTRGEMAVFIERALGNFSPNPNPTGMFADVPFPGLEHFTPFIEEFYNDGITTGCAANPLKYCPQNKVTRAEMAVFIVRAFGIPLP